MRLRSAFFTVARMARGLSALLDRTVDIVLRSRHKPAIWKAVLSLADVSLGCTRLVSSDTTPPSNRRTGRPVLSALRWLITLSVSEVALACGVILVVLQLALPQEVFFSPDEGMRLIASRAITLEGLWDGVIRYPSRELDPQAQFVPYFPEWFRVTPRGEVALDRRIVWFAAAIAPFQALGGVWLARLFSVFCAVLAGWLAGRVVQAVAGVGAGRVTTLMVMLGVPSSLYALLLWEHQLVLTLVAAALLFYVGFVRSARPLWAGLASLALLAACALRPETLLVAVPGIAVASLSYARARQTRLVPLAVCALLVVVAAGIYLLAGQDVPARLPRLLAGVLDVERTLRAFERVLIGHQASPATVGGWSVLSLAALVGGVLTLRRPRARGFMLGAVLWLGAGLTALAMLRVPPFQVTNPGLLSPLVLIALIGVVWRERDDLWAIRLALVLALLGLVLSALLAPNLIRRAGGVVTQISSTWGSRYLLAAYLVAAVGALATVGARWGAGGLLLRSGVLAALVIGAVTNLVGFERIRQDTTRVLEMCQGVWMTRPDAVVTSEWWLASECAADARVRFLLISDADRAGELTQVLFNNAEHLPAGARLALVWRDHAEPTARLKETLEACFSTTHESARSVVVGIHAMTLHNRRDVCQPDR